MRRSRRWPACLLAVVGFLAVASSSAAHTTLVATDPAQGVALDAPPTVLRLTFSEDVLSQFVQVRLAVGDAAAADLPARAEENVVTADVPDVVGQDEPESGRWRVGYRVVATDGHPLTGSFEFTVVAPVSTAEPSPTPMPTPTALDPAGSLAPRPAQAPSGRGLSLLPVSVTAVVLVSVAAIIAQRRRRQATPESAQDRPS